MNKELKRLVGRDHQLLHLYINVQQDMLESQNRKNYQSHPSPSSHPSSHPSSSSSSALTQRVSQHALGSDPASPRLENGGRGNEDDNAPSQDGCLTRCCASCITKFLCCCCLRKKAKLKVNSEFTTSITTALPSPPPPLLPLPSSSSPSSPLHSPLHKPCLPISRCRKATHVRTGEASVPRLQGNLCRVGIWRES